MWSQLKNTLLVLMPALLIALSCGSLAAWWVARYAFPGRSVFSVLLCLPFAFPPYLLAAFYKSIYHHNTLPIPNVEHPVAAGVILGLSLFPWVYLPMKSQIRMQSAAYEDVAATLGLKAVERFRRVHLPLLLPTLGLSSLLVSMEVFSDFGTVSLLGVKTLSVGIHDAMFNMFRADWAAQLSLLGAALPLVGLAAFALLTRRKGFYQPSNRSREHQLTRCSLPVQIAILISLTLLLAITLFYPLAMLCRWAWEQVKRVPLRDLPEQLFDSLHFLFWCFLLSMAISLVLALLLRGRRELRIWRPLSWVLALGYAMPAVMLAISLLFLSDALPEVLGDWILSESIMLLVLGGTLGYACFAYVSIQAGLFALSPRLDDLQRVLGLTGMAGLFRIRLPLLKRSLACAALLLLVNLAKELPLSQVLQPFGFQSLSLRLFSFAGMDLLEESALYALVMIGLVLYPVSLLDRLLDDDAYAHD